MNEAKSNIAHMITAYWPVILGAALAYTGMRIEPQGQYGAEAESALGCGTMLTAIAFTGVMLLVVTARKTKLPCSSVRIVQAIAIVALVAATAAMAFLDGDPAVGVYTVFPVQTVIALASTACMLYWLRILRGHGSVGTAIAAFSIIIVNEVLVFFCNELPPMASHASAAVLELCQLPLFWFWIRRSDRLADDRVANQAGLFAMAKEMMYTFRFLVAMALGIGALALVLGFLQGYPDGLRIYLTFETRLAQTLCVVAVGAVFLVLAARQTAHIMTTGIFLVMELVACLALVLYAGFPGTLDIGAVATNLLKALLNAYCWYAIVEFSTHGWRDPYYYGMAGWIVCYGVRAAAATAFLFFATLSATDIVVNSVLGLLVVISTQIVFMQFLKAERSRTSLQAVEHESHAKLLARQAAAEAELRRAAEAAMADAERLASERKAAEVAAAVAAVQEAAFAAVSEANHAHHPGQTLEEEADEARHLAEAMQAGEQQAVQNSDLDLATRYAVSLGLDEAFSEEMASTEAVSAPVARFLGLDVKESLADMRSVSLQPAVQALGERFMLSERETEVLALYAAGYTQKRVGEELSITPATVHAHVKRIYAKTGFHSRQDILDYLQQYGDKA